MKVKLLVVNLFLFFIFTSCIQGPITNEYNVVTEHPSIQLAAPSASFVTFTKGDSSQLFQVTVDDPNQMGYRTTWYYNGAIVSASSQGNNSYTIDPSSNTIIAGTYTLTYKMSNLDGTIDYGERTWYLTIKDEYIFEVWPGQNQSIKTTYGTQVSSNAEWFVDNSAFTVAGGTNYSFSVKTNNSISNGYKTLRVKFYYSDGATPVYITPVNSLIDQLSDNVFVNLKDYNPSFNFLALSTDIEENLYYQIHAEVYKFQDEFGVALATEEQVGMTYTWNVTLEPKNNRPIITHSGTTSAYKNETVEQDANLDISLNINSTEETLPANVKFEYYLSRSTEVNNEILLSDTTEEFDFKVAGGCTANGSQSCSVVFKSHITNEFNTLVPGHSKVTLNDLPVVPIAYRIKAVAIDNQDADLAEAKTSTPLYWDITTTESNTDLTLGVTLVNPGNTVINEGDNLELNINVSDAQLDYFCIDVYRRDTTTLVDTKIFDCYTNKPGFDPATAPSATNQPYYFTSSTLTTPPYDRHTEVLNIKMDEDTVSSGIENVTFVVKAYDILSASTSGTIQEYVLTHDVQNQSPEPIMYLNNSCIISPTDPTCGLNTQWGTPNTETFKVMTGVPFTIEPGRFSDQSVSDGNDMTFEWKIKIATFADPTDCRASDPLVSWTSLPQATNSGSPITLTSTPTAYPSTNLTWTPPQSIAGRKVCFQLYIKDDNLDSVGNTYEWNGSDGKGFVTAYSSTLASVGGVYEDMVLVGDEIQAQKEYFVSSQVGQLNLRAHTLASETLSTVGTGTLTIPSLNPGAAPEDITAVHDGSNLLVGAIIKSGTPEITNGKVYKLAPDLLSTVTDYTLPYPASSLGNIVYENNYWYMPFVNSNTDKVWISIGLKTDNGSLDNSYELEELGTGISEVNSTEIIKSDGTHYIVVSAKSAGTNIWTSAVYALTLANDFSTPLATITNVFGGTDNITNLRITSDHLSDNIYFAGINADQAEVIAFSKCSMTSYTCTSTAKIITKNEEGYEVSQTETSSLENIRMTRKSDGTVLFATQSLNRDIFLLSFDPSNSDSSQWAISTSDISYNVNETNKHSQGATFLLSSIYESYNSGMNTGYDLTLLSTEQSTKDTVFVYIEESGVDTRPIMINLESESILQNGENGLGWHPGFL